MTGLLEARVSLQIAIKRFEMAKIGIAVRHVFSSFKDLLARLCSPGVRLVHGNRGFVRNL
jgi:hypothetical protein